MDPWLGPFKGSLERRYAKAHEWIKKIDDVEGGVEKFSKVRHFRHNNRNQHLPPVYTKLTTRPRC